MEDTITAISTTTGVGAISIIRLSGIDAIKIVQEGKKNGTIDEDFKLIFRDDSCLFGSKTKGETLDNLLKSDKKIVYFASIQDLRGSEIVGGNFSANLNYSLESLDGSPKEVGGNYSILGCRYIKDIKGISPEIGGDLKLTNKPFLVFADFEYRKYSNIKGKIIKK